MSEATSLQWQDVLRERDDALARVVELERELKGVRMLCQEKIMLTDSSNTYCMLESGHDGKHSETPAAPCKRLEGETLVEGVSYSETEKAYYLYIRNGQKRFSIRVRKPDLHYSTPQVMSTE